MAGTAWWLKLDLVAPIAYILIDQEAERMGPEAGLDYKLQWASTVPKSQVPKSSQLPKTAPTAGNQVFKNIYLGDPQ